MSNKFSRVQKSMTVVFVMLIVMLSWYGPISEKAARYVDEGLTRSLVSFASARALNGVISVLQGTEVAMQPFGVGVTLALGEILDPINDVVEAFSSVMLTATVAFGIQKLLLTIGSNWTISAFVTGIALIWSALLLAGRVPSWLSQLLVVLLFVRFVMPVTMIGSGYIFEHFAANDYQENQGALDSTLEKLKGLYPDASTSPAKKDSQPQSRTENLVPANELLEGKDMAPLASIRELYDKTMDAAKGAVSDAKGAVGRVAKDSTAALREKYEALKNVAEDAVRKIVKIIVIFLMQTIVVPLILLWFLYRLLGGLLLKRSTRSPEKAAV